MAARILGYALMVPTAVLGYYSLVLSGDDIHSRAWYDEWALDLVGTTPVRWLAGLIALLVGGTALDLITGNDWWWRRTDTRFR